MGALKTRALGKRGIQVTEIGMGLWAAGGEGWGPTDDRAVLDAIDVALDAGVNFFDTSDVYGAGHSEEVLGQAMRGRRDRFIVASKIGWQGFDRARDRSAYDSVAKLVAGVESNLRRLQTDYIDVMQSHIDHRDPTMEAVVEGFQRLCQHSVDKDGCGRAKACWTSGSSPLSSHQLTHQSLPPGAVLLPLLR